jgi:hypothetical protein
MRPVVCAFARVGKNIKNKAAKEGAKHFVRHLLVQIIEGSISHLSAILPRRQGTMVW